MHPRAAVNSANASRQGRSSFWTNARIEKLRILWVNKVFVEDIAAAIGNGCTRNMVIGKARREKLRRRIGWNKFGNERHKPLIRVSCETKEGVAA